MYSMYYLNTSQSKAIGHFSISENRVLLFANVWYSPEEFRVIVPF